MANYMKFEAVFEDEQEQEYDKKQLIIPIQVDLDSVEQWFPDIDNDFDLNMDYTTVVFKSGHTRCLNIHYNNFTLEMNSHYSIGIYTTD